MPEKPVANTGSINPNLLFLKPRPLLLLSNSTTMKLEKSSSKTQTLKPEQKTLLLHSIAKYLENVGGFSKTLKKFKAEAKLENDDLGGTSLIDLEEVFCKFLKTSDDTGKKLEGNQAQDTRSNDISRREGEDVSAAGVETVSTKKKKKSVKSDGDATDKQLGGGDKPVGSDGIEENVANDTVPVEVKSKEKKKKKSNSDSLGQEQVTAEALKESVDNIVSELPDKKLKDKKKKKSNSESELQLDNVGHQPSEPVTAKEKDKNVVSVEGDKVIDSVIEDKSKDKKKSRNKLSDSTVENVEHHAYESKEGADADSRLDNKNVKSERKKKRKESDVSENLSGEMIDEGKSNKMNSEKGDSKNSKEDADEKDKKSLKKRKRLPSEDDAIQPADEKAPEESKHRKTKSSEEQEENGKANGKLEENGEKSAGQKSVEQTNGTAEPKTVKHFQRVKADEVVFSDERLKDNSYWAKDGAENGYGAKAQEVLGQVRGRDFRHEKTKKKRGSYRGGQIDFNSHSVKFNYSDEE